MRKPLCLAIGLALLAGCGEGEKADRGIVVLGDMGHTPAHKSQTALERRRIGGDGREVVVHVPTALLPPAGTRPRGELVAASDPADRAGAAALANPLLPTARVLLLGQHRYETACGVCHGADGNSAHAPVAKHFPGIPSIGALAMAGQSDGELFHIITHGKNNRMPALAGQVTVEERWAVVHYLRALARANAAVKPIDAVRAEVSAAQYSSTAAATRVIEDHARDAAALSSGSAPLRAPLRPDPRQTAPSWQDAPAKKGH